MTPLITADERTRLLAWFATRTFRVLAEPGSTGYSLRPHPAYHVYLHLLFWLSLLPFATGWAGEHHGIAPPTARPVRYDPMARRIAASTRPSMAAVKRLR